jgi:hypothetical protein
MKLLNAICLLSMFACMDNPSSYGKVTFYNSTNKNSFIFSVNEEYLQTNPHSKKDENYPQMTESEAKLLIRLLSQQNYCLNNDGKTLFKITSKQEKIYDITFSHLIEQNYNAKPVTPRTYFGECK